MSDKNFKKAIIVGLGGMGIRHFKALTKLKIKIVAICDKDNSKFKKYNIPKNIKIVQNYKKLLGMNVDLVCIASNTSSTRRSFDRFGIVEQSSSTRIP